MTAFAPTAPALEAREVVAPPGTTVNPDFLQVTDSVARGTPDLLQVSAAACPTGMFCAEGAIKIDHSNFVSREPAAGGPGDEIAVGPGNQSGDPLFTDAAAGDFHLRAGSPAIDAGDDLQGRALPTDADGHPRLQGAAIDLGAYEFSPPPSSTGTSGSGQSGPGDGSSGPSGGSSGPSGGSSGPSGGSSGPGGRPRDTVAPTLGRLRLSRARFRAAAGTTLTATTSENGQLLVAVQHAAFGRQVHGRCVSTKSSGAPCRRWVPSGSTLTRRVAKPGGVKVAFGGQFVARRLVPGNYRFVVNAIDAAGNRSAPRTISFTILRPPR